MNTNLIIILFLPLAGYLALTFLGKYLSKPIGGILACVLVSISFLLGIIVFNKLHSGGSINAHLFTWIETAGLSSAFGLQIDALSSIMLLVVTGIGALIHIYSIGYMHGDENFNKFFSYMNLFIFFMLLLIMSDNYILLFAGWEGVGLCSYLLIGFWYKNPEFAKAANKAFIMNRIGDLGLLLGIAIIFYTFHSVSFQEINAAIGTGSISTGNLTLIACLLLIGAIGKSAQIPLFTWLPDAMAGPTPVSALIHAATMVTAGVYLIIRSHLIYSLSPLIMSAIVVLGISTSLFAAAIALMQNDIKKILAYSTISQLGLMFFALGLGAYSAALFHLVTHAFFKALLFLGAGSVIHSLHGEQDIRNMGGLKDKTKLTFLVMLIGTAAISGIPPLSGFFSKDHILSAALGKSALLWTLGITASLMTAFYMFRLFFVVFYGKFRGTSELWDKVHESPAVMVVPLLILSFLSVVGGVLNLPHIFGGNEWLTKYLAVSNAETSLSINTEWAAMFLILGLIAGIVFLAYHIYLKKSKVPLPDIEIHGFLKLLSKKFYIDEVYDFLIIKPLNYLSALLYNIIELKFLDRIVDGIGLSVKAGSSVLRYVQSGNVSIYLMLMVLGIILVLVFNIFI